MTSNTMPVRASTDSRKLAAAIAARMRSEGHTVLECFGPVAAAIALQVCDSHSSVMCDHV